MPTSTRKIPNASPPLTFIGFSPTSRFDSGAPVVLIALAWRTASIRTKNHQNGIRTAIGPAPCGAMLITITQTAKNAMARW